MSFFEPEKKFSLSVDIMTLDDLLPLFTFFFTQLYALADFARVKLTTKSYTHFVTTILGTAVTCSVLLLLVGFSHLPTGEIRIFFSDFDKNKVSTNVVIAISY